jgi:hypothetical protein
MAAIRLNFWRRSSATERHTSTASSVRGRELIREGFKRSGGPTEEFKRVYGEYLAYKKAKPAADKD